jgi:hypothetical protein
VLLLAQMTFGAIVNLVLLGPVFAGPSGFLVNAAANPLRVGLAAIVGLATGVLSIGLAIAVWPVLRASDQASALWFLALTLVAAATGVLENASLLSMLSLSQAYAKADASSGATFQILRGMVASTRNCARPAPEPPRIVWTAARLARPRRSAKRQGAPASIRRLRLRMFPRFRAPLGAHRRPASSATPALVT